MKIIAYETETPPDREILAHIDEPTHPPPIRTARPCATLPAPLGYQTKPSTVWPFAAPPQLTLLRLGTSPNHPGLGVRCSIAAHPPREDASVELEPDYDPLAQPEPEIEFDQRIQW